MHSDLSNGCAGRIFRRGIVLGARPWHDVIRTKKTLEFLATTRGRMILISEVADLAPIERLHIPTKPQAYTGTFWSYTPAQ